MAEVAGLELLGGGEMGALMRAFDWSRSPLGEPATWPRSLKTVVRIMLSSRQPIWIGWGKDLIYLYNDPCKPIIGARHPWAFGRPAHEVWPETWPQIGPMLATAMAGDEGTYVEAHLLIMERSGYPEETYYTYSYTPVPGDDGGTGGIICANTDDTKRVIGERQLALLRELATATANARTVQAACERSAAALATNRRDLPFAMIYLSEPKQECLSLAGSSGIGRDHPAAAASVQLASNPESWPLAEVLADGRPRIVGDIAGRFGAEFPAGSWTKSPTRAALIPIRSAGEAAVGVVVAGLSPFRLFDDDYQSFLELAAGQISAGIASAKASEEERRHAEKLAELDRAKTNFFSSVSHELRTPLTLMLSPLEELLAQPSTEIAPQHQELLQIAQRNSLRLLRQVNALLDFSRVEAGRIYASYEPLDLAALTIDIASNFRSACERAGLEFAVDCPSLAGPVYIDRDMWEKIVLNLLSNAFKFTFHGRIGVTLRAEGSNIVLAVSDTGVGMPPDELPHVFERFRRIEGQRGRTHEGTGIGLALVQELVRLHGGDICVESAVGQGTTFSVTIPSGHAHLPADRINLPLPHDQNPPGPCSYVEEALRRLPNASRPAVAAETRYDATAPGFPAPARSERAHVLLADDNADMRDYICHLLSTHWDVEAVADGQSALDAAHRRKPDLVLADIMMPRMDGMTLLSALRRDSALGDVPVILLSVRANREAEVEALESGADDYLVKPFSARQLVARVSSCLALARQRAERLASMARLEQLNTRLAGSSDLPSLHEILDATIEQQGADFGNIQLYNHATRTLEIVAQRGFEPGFLEYFQSVTADDCSACGTALRERRRVTIEDVLTDQHFLPHRRIAASAGFRAVQSTPLFQRGSGAPVGILSTHFREPHPRFDRAAQAVEIFAQLAADIIASRLSERRLRTSETRLQGAVDLAQLGSYTWDPRTNTLELDSRVIAMWGLPPGAHVSHAVWRGAIHPKDRAQFDAALARSQVHQHGGIFEAEFRVLGVTDGVTRWIATRGSASFEDDRVVAFLGVALDITTRKRTEQANLLLISELQHRTRNLLGVVSAIASETHEASCTLDDFFHMFSGRLASLSRVQNLLSRGDFQPATISELVHLELRALGAEPDGRRVAVAGPEVALPTESVQILALALHELATNARKHGALTVPGGRITIDWRTTGNLGKRGLTIEWRESGAGSEAIVRPARRGFGRTLIEEALPYQLDAQTRFEFVPDGICCVVAISLEPKPKGGWQ